MSYRNDHDAAIARVDILERELEQMAGEYEKTRSALEDRSVARPRERWAGTLAGMGLAVFAIGAMVSGIVLTHDRSATAAVEPTEPTVAMPTVVTTLGDLASCLGDVVASTRLATGLDARTTDPRGQRRSVDDIARIGAACRPELARASMSGNLDRATRDAIAEWSRREDELAGASSRLLVYYSSDPYAINNYVTAVQVWRELDAARSSRDALIATEGATLRRAVGAL